MRSAAAARRLIGTLVLGGLLAASPVVVASAAEAVPDDVAEWFANQASVVIAETQRTAVTSDDEPVLTYSQVAVGAPRPLTTWSDEYIDGVVDADPTVSLDQWVAPLVEAERPVGVVSAVRAGDRSIALAYFDDNAVVAAGLVALPPDATVVYDGPLDAFFVIRDEVVAPLSSNSTRELSSRAPVDSFQEQLAARYGDVDRDATQPPADDPASARAASVVRPC